MWVPLATIQFCLMVRIYRVFAVDLTPLLIWRIDVEDPVHVIGVLDESSGHEALYVGGDLKETDFTLHLCDVGRVAEGKAINFTFIVVEMLDGMEFPKQFEHLMQYIKDETVEEKIDYAADQMM